MKEMVTAEVILRTRSGSSILDAAGGPTSENIDLYRVEEEVIDEARTKLTGQGIEVVQAGPVSLSIRTSKALFERIFQTNLSPTASIAPGGGIIYAAAAPIKIPEDWTNVVAMVVLPIPPVFHP